MRGAPHILLGGLLAAAAWGCGTSGGGPSDAAQDGTLEGGPDAPLDAGDAAEEVAQRGGRLLGLDINAAEDGNYLEALHTAREAGVQVTNVAINWADLESTGDAGPDGGDGGVTYFNPYLHIANLVFPPNQTKVSLAIRAVDTVGPKLPADLAGRPLDDPKVILRFNAAQDYVFSEIPDLSLSMYVVGNEIDRAFGADPAKWAAFKTFFDAAAAYARTKRAGVSVGATTSLRGATEQVDLLAPIVASADFLGITYYPLNADFSVRPASSMRADFDKLLALYPGKPILVREAGCPSGSLIDSSPAQQADFVRELFRIWDVHADRMPLLTFFTMTEYSPAGVEDLARYYGVSDPKFKDYLGTLGLRTYSPGAGANKPAWDALAQGAHARGW